MKKWFKNSDKNLYLKGIFLLLTALLIFQSCSKDSEFGNDEYFVGNADFYIKKIKVDGEVLYAPYYGLYSNISIRSANVETPNGDNVELKPHEFLTTYIKVPDETDYTSSAPASGTYRFSGTYGEDEPFEINDIFNGRLIDFPKIDSVGYDSTDKHLYIYWEKSTGVSMYKIRLLNKNGIVVFDGVELTANSNVFGIDQLTSGWNIAPYKGDVYTLQLHAFSFDAEATESNWIYNIECNAVTETSVVWGD